MPLAGRSQAHDESERAFGNATLVGMGDDRRVEDGGGLQRVLAGEEGADEEFPLVGKRALGEDMATHLLVMALQQRLDVEVPRVEFLPDGAELFAHLPVGESKGASDDRRDAVGLLRNEGPDDDPGALRKEGHFMPPDVDHAHGAKSVAPVRGCVAPRISARAMWNARVDSAP